MKIFFNSSELPSLRACLSNSYNSEKSIFRGLNKKMHLKMEVKRWKGMLKKARVA
jgi:hypothetical protein